MGPVAGGELVLDQPVGGRGVRHAQQRLGQHHQRQALLGGQRIGMEKVLDPAETAGPGADRLDQPAGALASMRGSASALRAAARQQPGGDRLIRRRIGRREWPDRPRGVVWHRLLLDSREQLF